MDSEEESRACDRSKIWFNDEADWTAEDKEDDGSNVEAGVGAAGGAEGWADDEADGAAGGSADGLAHGGTYGGADFGGDGIVGFSIMPKKSGMLPHLTLAINN